MKQRFGGSQSKTLEEKGRLLDNVTQTVHKVLFAAYQHSEETDSDDEADPSTDDGPDFQAFATDLQRSGHQSRLASRTHSNSDFRGAL